MDKEQFDRLAKALANGMSRRRALKGAAAAGLAGLVGLPRRIAAQEGGDFAALEATAAGLLSEYVWDSGDALDAQTYELLKRVSAARSLTRADQTSLADEVEQLANAYFARYGAEDESGVDQGGGTDAALSATDIAHPRWRCIRRCIWGFLLCLLACRGNPLCRLWCLIRFIRCLIRCRRLHAVPVARPVDAVGVAAD
jgi:hypothetical protein